MRKLKLLLSIVAIAAMLFTVAYANGSIVTFSAETVTYTEGQDLVVTLYAAETIKLGPTSSIEIAYPADIWEVKSATTTLYAQDASGKVTNGDYAVNTFTPGVVNIADNSQNYAVWTEMTKDQAILTMTFTLKAGATAENSIISVNAANSYAVDEYWSQLTTSGSIKVVAGSSSETKEATVSETAIVDKNGDTWTFTDAKAFLISATGFTKTSGTISCELTLANSTGTPKVLTTNPVTVATFENATITFQALVHGIDDGVTITGASADVTVE